MLKRLYLHYFLLFFIFILFITQFIYPPNLFSQQQSDTTETGKKKPKILFNNQLEIADSTQVDTVSSKIIFKKSYFLKKDELKLISKKKYELRGVQHFVGDEGEFIIEAMGTNQRSIDLVKQANKSRKTGTTLMIVAGAAFIVGMATIPYVELGSTESGGYQTTYYWLPPVTIAMIIGGIGYVQHSSYERKLREAVKAYNEDLTKSD